MDTRTFLTGIRAERLAFIRAIERANQELLESFGGCS